MANSLRNVTLFVASALCFLSLLRGGSCNDTRFFVEGQVYCDTCRAQFVTRVSELMAGAKVRLECKNREGGQPTYSVEGETDNSGTYRLPVVGDHEDEECGIVLVKSSNPECDEISKDGWTKTTSSKISLTANNGITTPVRQANPLGFLKKEPLKECPDVFSELGMVPDDV